MILYVMILGSFSFSVWHIDARIVICGQEMKCSNKIVEWLAPNESLNCWCCFTQKLTSDYIGVWSSENRDWNWLQR